MNALPETQFMTTYPGSQPVSSGPRTLHLYSEGAFSRGIRVLDGDKVTPLYNAEFHSWSKPNIEIYALSSPQAGTTTKIGSASFHTFSSRIDMVVRGQRMELTRNGTFSSGHQWRSLALGGRLLKWKTDGAFGSDKVCYISDVQKTAIARWERSSMSMSKKGKIHILDPSLATPGNPALEELLVSAIIEIEVARRRSSSSGGGGGVDGGGGGGGGC